MKKAISRILNKVAVLLAGVLTFVSASGQKTDPPFLKYLNSPWVDSVFKTLSTEEKIAQLVWVEAFSNRDISHEIYLSDLIKSTGIGGVIFFQDQPAKQSEMINYFQQISRVPLLVVTDGEWGLGMRLKGIVDFPYQMTLGAIRNDSLIYEMGKAIAGQFRRAGLQINLAPVADVNNNPMNPVINYRSFGEDPSEVAAKSIMYMKGLQDNGIFSVGKHFPGHGDTEIDSHLDLPVLKHTKARLDSVELAPFRKLIDAGVSGIMPGHLNVVSIDSTPALPATLSYPILTGLLRNKLLFNGLIISDAMNMGAVTKHSVPGEAEVQALKAGMDILEYVENPRKTIKMIADRVAKGDLPIEMIDLKCRKVLAAKYWTGLNKITQVKEDRIAEDLSSPGEIALIRDLYASSLTLLKNENNIVPVKHPEKIRIASLAINSTGKTLFQKRLASYHPCDNYNISTENQKEIFSLLKKLKKYDLVIAGIYGTHQKPEDGFGLMPGLNAFIDSLTMHNRCIMTFFGNPYALNYLEAAGNASALLLSYQENEFTEDLSAQLIFGAIGAKGSLPVTINDRWKLDSGILTPGNMRVQYGVPENAGVSSEKLITKVDSIAMTGLAKKAYPGCEVLIARKGIVIFNKAYGYQTYENRTPLSEDDLFDLASVTKVSSTLAGLMVLDSEGKFSVEKRLGDYVPYFKRSDKGDLKMIDILTHQAGLVAWIPFWKETIRKNGEYKKRIYHPVPSAKYPLEVAPGLYIKENYRDKMLSEIKKSKLGEKKYLYSDNGLIVSTDIISKLAGEKWYRFVYDSIYHKIGAYDITFNPLQRYPLSRIVPTEYDSLFRRQQIWGTVHDEGAALQGGISGHAGLFATGNDLMKLMELYRRMGNYAGEQIISSDVLKRYSTTQFAENRNKRGIGFDKPSLNNADLPERQAYPAKSVSPESFGHSGFTGTFVWVDPKYEISYVFLSNHVYPTRNNNVLSELGIRGSILQAVYDSIIR